MKGEWYRGYLVAPPSLLAGLTSTKGQTLEARVFSGIFPASCVEVREVLGEDEEIDEETERVTVNGHVRTSAEGSPRRKQFKNAQGSTRKDANGRIAKSGKAKKKRTVDGKSPSLSLAAQRDPNTPKPPAPVPMLKIGDETPTSASEPLVDEIASCLREWQSTKLHEFLLSRQYALLDQMAGLVQSLDLSRRQFLHDVLTTYEMRLLREKTVWDLVRGNKLFNGEIIVRDPAERGRVLTGDDSAIEITRLQSMMSLLDERPQPPAHESLALHHLLVDVKAFVGASTEATTLVFYLATKSPGTPVSALTESYIVEVPPNGSLTNLAKMGQMRTFFTDLASADIGDPPGADTELYLVVKVRSRQQIRTGKPGSRSGSRDSPVATRNGEIPQTSNGAGKAGRRSLMWGQKAQRATPSRNPSTTSQLNPHSEDNQGRNEDEDRPPSTTESRSMANNLPKRGTISRIVTRTVGIGVLRLNTILKQDEEIEPVMDMWTPSTGSLEKHDMGNGWEEVIRELMDSKSKMYEKSRRAERLHLHLKPFKDPDADALIKATPTLLSGIVITSKMGFSGAPTKSRSDIYVTIDEAFVPRHALLSRSSGSATTLPSTLQGANLQVTLEARRANGDRIEDCIYSSSNADGESSWESTAAEQSGAWHQTLRLSILPKDVPGSHLVMVVADVPNQPFAICYIPLWDQQAFMKDGHHSLLLYKYDDSTSSPKGNATGKGGYLYLNWNARGKDNVSKDETLTGPLATLRMHTYLCSTRFSQDRVLLGLLKWNEQSPGNVQELLKRLVFVPEIEIVKLLNDVFDSIFGLLVEHSGNDDYEDLIFSALITVLGIVHDRRFNLGPLVDQYAEIRFNYPFATPCLVRSFTRLLAKPSDPETSRKLRATFKVVRHILKFITHARGQQKEKEAGIGITSTSPGFTRHLRSIFKALDGLMRNTAPIFVGSQTLAVQHFHTWLPELTGLLGTEEILHIAIDFMDSCALVKGKLILYKLVLVINYSKLALFSHPEQKAALTANTVRWIAPHWGKTEDVTEQWREQVRLCCSILATQVAGIGPQIPDYIPKIIDSYLGLQSTPKTSNDRISLLFPTTYPFPSKPISETSAAGSEFDEVLIELSAILSAIGTSPNGMQLELADDEMATLVEDMLHVHLSILQCEAFPADWLSVHIYHHKSTMKTLEYLAGLLLGSFLPHPDEAEDYNTELWKVFFTVLLKLVGSDALALETFPEQKRRAVWKIAGDVRENGAELLRRSWEAIGWETGLDERHRYGLPKMGGYQVQYVPVLVGPIVELCLSVHEGLRHVAVEVLQTMIVSEWTLGEDLSVIQTEMIDCLDRLFKTKPLTESIPQKLFINELLGLFQPLAHVKDDPLYAALEVLIATIDEFLDLLVAVHSTDGAGEASHMIHRLRLMEFLKDMQKEEIYIQYVHQLTQLQADARNPTEAGLALRLHADLYEWDPTKILPSLTDPEFPSQSQFDRKERIYFDIIKHFEDGEAWSSALAAYQELQAQYQDNVFDFPKLARTQRSIATIYETIGKSDKLVPKYFRVVYKGLGFSPSMRDKEFVFEGSPTERMTVFTDRMQEQHPSAQIITTGGEVEDVEGQFLLISALSPYRDYEHHVFQRARVSQPIRDYLLSAHPQVFSVTSKRDTSGPVIEHSAEKTIYAVAEPFPTILRCSEVVSVDRLKLSPVQTALERIVRKTQEMAAVENRVIDGEQDMAPLLVDSVAVSVNPTSDASVARYRDLIPSSVPSEEEEVEEIELTPLENALKIALIDHAILIKRCLSNFSAAFSPVLQSRRQELAQSNTYFSLDSYPRLPYSPFKIHASLYPHLAKAYTDFEDTFSPELASFIFPRAQTRDAMTPSPSWAISSPVLSETREVRLPQSETNGTMATTDTSILDPAPQRTSRNLVGNRLSFLRRSTTQLPKATDEIMAERLKTPGRRPGNTTESDDGRERVKEDRRSLFDVNGVTGRGRVLLKDSELDEKDEDAGWVTERSQSDLTSASDGGVGKELDRRSSSSQRPVTATSVGSRVGSVRKRLSMLRLGKKSSKASVLVSSVAEEE